MPSYETYLELLIIVLLLLVTYSSWIDFKLRSELSKRNKEYREKISSLEYNLEYIMKMYEKSSAQCERLSELLE